VKMNIPLIFYGESGSDYGNPLKENDMATRSFQDYEFFDQTDLSNVYLSGISLEELISDYGIGLNDFSMYLPPDPNKVIEKKIEVHWLGYYMKWHPQGAYYYASNNTNFVAAPERTVGTYSTYNSIDDKMDDFHFYTTYIKFGIGRASYDASQEIRNGEIDREEGIMLVNKYDGEYPARFMNEICDYLTIDQKTYGDLRTKFKVPDFTSEYFDKHIDKFRSPHLWQKNSSGHWELRHKIK